jgi:acyl-CoA synthetase (AMP-forming)/AMP-acid ligase II
MIHRSRLADIEVPVRTLIEHVLGAADQRAGKPALVDGATGEVTTYGELAARVRGAAAALAERGVGHGDVVALVSPNDPCYPVVVHAVCSVGAAVSTLNPLLTADEVAQQLRDAHARLLVAAPSLLEAARLAAAAAGIEAVAIPDVMRPDGDPPKVAIDPERDLAALPFSSGTTGISKGVMLTHRNLVANLVQAQAIHRIGPDDVLVGVLPFFHIYGQVIVLNHGLAGGAKIVTLPRFELERFLGVIEEHRVTVAHVVPPIVLALANAPAVSEYDLSSLRAVMCGAAPLDEELAARAEERIGCMIRQGYGMTEASPLTHGPPDGHLDEVSPGVIGWLVSNTEARIVDPETEEDTDGDGELWLRGPQVMRGYLGDPEATARTLTADGWLRTGDVARLDADGEYRIVDRLKELIKYKGFQVAPAELEALLLTHPAVADVAVVPMADEEAGEVPKAFVVAREELAADGLMAWVAERVAPHKRVRAIEWVDEIPRSPSGKILRRVLRDRGRVAGAR